MEFDYLINLRVPSPYSFVKRTDVVVENTLDDLKGHYYIFQ